MTAAVTLPPANAALVAAGVQTIVTLPTKPKALTAGDRLVIHAGTKLPKGGQHIGEFIVDDDGEGPYLVRRVGRYKGEPLPMFTHPGHIVASAVVRDVVPIVHIIHAWLGDAPFPNIQTNGPDVATLVGANDDVPSVRLTDQLPFADFTPGRWAVLLDDVTPTTERCPACWGTWAPCRVCFTPNGYVGGAGTCPPIPWRGRPDVWRWEP